VENVRVKGKEVTGHKMCYKISVNKVNQEDSRVS
jgi:hypothetical protein